MRFKTRCSPAAEVCLEYKEALLNRRGRTDKNRCRNNRGERISILCLVLSIGETSCPYNEFSLALRNEQDITICTYFRSGISPPKEIIYFEGNNTLMGFLRALKAALNETEYDIVHAHTPHVGFLFLVASILSPKTVMRATVYTVHSSFRNYTKSRTKLLLIPVFGFFRRVVCCSRVSFESIPSFYRWLAGERLRIVQNGVDIERIDRIVGRTRNYLHDGRFHVATIGRLIEVKNPMAVLSAFQESASNNSRLLIIGEGILRDRLLSRVEGSFLEKQVNLTGLIPRVEVYKLLAKIDLLVSTSRVEGLPIGVLEAMACRCPVLLSDIPSHREVAGGVEFIPLIPPDDVSGFAREIKRFRRMSAWERADIGERCRKLVENRFSLPAMHIGYEEVYAQVLGK